MFTGPKSERGTLKNILEIVAELTRRSLDFKRIPFEYRPVTYFKNVRVHPRRLSRLSQPSSFYLGAKGNSVVLVYDDELIEYQFDDMSMLETQIRVLESLEIKRLDFADGLSIAVFILAVFAVVLQFVVWFFN